MPAKIEIVFDKKTGNFVVHYDGVESHAKEHEFTDELIALLQKAGYEIKIGHHHDDSAPKIPDIETEDAVLGRVNLKGG